MINLYVTGYQKGCIRTDAYFDRYYDVDWFSDELVQRIIKEIDGSIVERDDRLIDYRGKATSPITLCSGTKSLIMMLKTDYNVYATRCGDNCIPFIEEIQRIKDITITLHHCMKFSDGIVVKFLDSGVITDNREDFIDEWYRCYH